jgi:hypothetical protein
MVSDLREMSYDDLLQMFLNAVTLIVKEKQIEAAKRMILAIEAEWKRRRSLGDGFTGFERPEMGMLGALGYHVGHAEGRPPRLRREILTFMLIGELPMVHSATYTEEWGEPGSLKRYRKLVRFLQNNIESNQTKPNMKLAVKDWTEDLAWLQEYSGG